MTNRGTITPGRTSLSREATSGRGGLIVLVCLVSVVGVTVSVLISAARPAGADARNPTRAARTPYDGLIFRVQGKPVAVHRQDGRWGFTCTSRHLKEQDISYSQGDASGSSATTVRPSVTGKREVAGDVDLLFDRGRLVAINGYAQSRSDLASGHTDTTLLSFNNTPEPPNGLGCGPLPTVASSPAGNLFAIRWVHEIYGGSCGKKCTRSSQDYQGSGCAAVFQSAKTTAVTVEVGACTPSVLPRP
jgi:hypothetical protein